jgi:1-phosphatidylinositol-4-phosphate 5-kinase
MVEAMQELGHLCFYDTTQCPTFQIIEHAPSLFLELRKKSGITEEYLFQSFAPLHNLQAIHNFFTGSGKSSSFFFFSDNKAFVLKTLKDSEKKLMLE